MSDTVDFQFLARKIDQVLDQGRRLDQQHLQVLEALLLLQKTVVNLDRRMSDVKDELELTIKIELGGRLANMESRVETRAQQGTEDLLNVLAKMFSDENLVSFEQFAKAGRQAVNQQLHLFEN